MINLEFFIIMLSINVLLFSLFRTFCSLFNDNKLNMKIIKESINLNII